MVTNIYYLSLNYHNFIQKLPLNYTELDILKLRNQVIAIQLELINATPLIEHAEENFD